MIGKKIGLFFFSFFFFVGLGGEVGGVVQELKDLVGKKRCDLHVKLIVLECVYGMQHVSELRCFSFLSFLSPQNWFKEN